MLGHPLPILPGGDLGICTQLSQTPPRLPLPGSTMLWGKTVDSNFVGFETNGGFPKIRGTLLGVPITRIIAFWAPYLGPLIYGKYQIPSNNLYLRGPICLAPRSTIRWCRLASRAQEPVHENRCLAGKVLIERRDLYSSRALGN